MPSKEISPLLASSLAKYGRYREHGKQLRLIMEAFVEKDPYAVIDEDDPQTGDKTLYLLQRTEFPAEEISLTLGDCINNLKAALDHAAFQVAVHFGVTINPKYIKFPCRSDRSAFDSECKSIFAEVDWLQQWMKAKEVFPNGRGNNIYYLTQLNNIDKHRVIRLVAQATGHPSVSITYPNGGTSQLYSNTIVGSGRLPFAVIPAGCQYTMQTDCRIPIDVFFADRTHPPGALDIINGIAGEVADILNTLNDEVLKRS